MSLTESDAKQLIRDVFDSFQQLRARDIERTRVLYGSHGDDLEKELVELGFKRPAASTSRAGLRWKADARTGLDGDVVMSASPRRKRLGGHADELEVGAAYMLLEADDGQRFTDGVKDAMIAAPFAGVWQVLDPFKPPSKASEIDDYLEGRLFFHLEVDPGRGTAFVEDKSLVTLAVRRLEKTIYQVARDFNRTDDPNAMRVWDEQFDGFRASYGLDEWSDYQRPGGKRIVIWQLDDGTDLWHLVEGGKGWFPISKKDTDGTPVANPIGRPMFHFACGYYNSDAERPEDRYAPFLAPCLDQLWKVDLGESMVKSWDLSFSARVNEMDPQILKIIEDKTTEEAQTIIDSVMVRESEGVLKVIGKFVQGGANLNETLRYAIDHDREDLKLLVPRQPLSEQTMRNATATSLAVEQQTRDQQYGGAQRQFTRLIHDVVEDGLALYRRSDKSHFRNTRKAKTFIALKGLTHGTETVKGKQVDGGTAVYLGEDELGKDASWYDLKVEYRDMSAQAVAARKMQADDDRDRGAIDLEQWFEARGVTNVSDQIKRMDIERRKTNLMPALDGAAMTSAFMLVQQMTGLPMEEITAAMAGPGALPQDPTMAAGASGNGSNGNGASYSVGAPAPNERPVAVAS